MVAKNNKVEQRMNGKMVINNKGEQWTNGTLVLKSRAEWKMNGKVTPKSKVATNNKVEGGMISIMVI
jgi:hypothetical protein